MGTGRNQLVYLEISGYQLLSPLMTTPHVLPDEVYTVQLLEQQVEGHKEQQKEFSVYGQLVANSMLYRYTHHIILSVVLYACILFCVVCIHVFVYVCVRMCTCTHFMQSRDIA